MNATLTACLMVTFIVLWGLLVLMQPVRLSVSRPQGFPPFVTTAQVIVPRHAENRELCVTLAYGGLVEDEGCWQVTGASSPVFSRKWTLIESGRHFAQARLLRGRETLFSNVVELNVLGEEP